MTATLKNYCATWRRFSRLLRKREYEGVAVVPRRLVRAPQMAYLARMLGGSVSAG